MAVHSVRPLRVFYVLTFYVFFTCFYLYAPLWLLSGNRRAIQVITIEFLISRGLSFRGLSSHDTRLSLDYLQIVRPLAKTGDNHIEESTEYNEVSTEYNEVITKQGSTEYNGLCTEYNSVSTRNNEETPNKVRTEYNEESTEYNKNSTEYNEKST